MNLSAETKTFSVADKSDQRNIVDEQFQVILAGFPTPVFIMRNYETWDDGILWLCNPGTVLDGKKNKLLPTVHNGEIVIVEGEKYKVDIKGCYSDCGILHKVDV